MSDKLFDLIIEQRDLAIKALAAVLASQITVDELVNSQDSRAEITAAIPIVYIEPIIDQLVDEYDAAKIRFVLSGVKVGGEN